MSPEAQLSARAAAETTEPLVVQLGDRRYPIHVASGLLDRAGAILAPLLPQPLVLLVTDTNVA
jgi:3-dehydroquinate synthase